ncbi:hypothetical protein BDQ12DRAFT_735923 [Crucibulum laeve]|uniref:Uncharacterized protein n=1 Tax=Crucibulum laeve TaxID=68775 RepID=A0A5C3LY10_9AGAR|nr:hypothetical protein BDQ12DRAFT_735923 [Crucibulum laeve]
MTILITGGTGKSGLKLAKLLQDANYPFLIASRAGAAPAPFKAVRFDWLDATTFENPFTADPSIDRIYLIGPTVDDMFDRVKPFIDLAFSKGVRRFVLLSGALALTLAGGNHPHKLIYQHLLSIGAEYSILRPTWFMDNFSTVFSHSIKNEDHVFSLAEDGRIPFVATQDIAQAAFDVLVAENAPNNMPYLVGPELLSYDEAAEVFTEVLGRKIIHKRNTREEQIQFYQQRLGGTKAYAEMLSDLEDKLVAQGSEVVVFNTDPSEKVVGQVKLRDYIIANKETFNH